MPFQHPESVEPAVDLVDLIGLPGEIVRAESAGVGGRLAVIGDAEVVVSRRLAGERQLFDRVGAVGVAGVAVEKALEHPARSTSRGQLLFARQPPPRPAFPQLRRNEAQAQRLVEGRLVGRGHELAAPPERRAVQGEPLSPRRARPAPAGAPRCRWPAPAPRRR